MSRSKTKQVEDDTPASKDARANFFCVIQMLLPKSYLPCYFIPSNFTFFGFLCYSVFFCISSSVILPFVSYLIFLRSALGSLFFFLYPSFCIFLNLSEPVLIVGLSFCELALPFLLFHCFFSCIFTLFSVSLFFFISF